MTIALIGNEGAGKDYIGIKLKKKFNVSDDKYITFASPIHNLLKDMLDCDTNSLDRYKRRKEKWYFKYLKKIGIIPVYRKTLMDIGNSIRKSFGSDIFLKTVKLDNDITIVTDLRFLREYRYLRKGKLIIIDIKQPDDYDKTLKTTGYELEEIIELSKKDDIYYEFINRINDDNGFKVLVSRIKAKFI